MNILITGITGFFGRNFVNYLMKNKVECFIIGTVHNENKYQKFILKRVVGPFFHLSHGLGTSPSAITFYCSYFLGKKGSCHKT